MIENKGHYSGSKRLDSSTFKEPDHDTEQVKEKWLGGKREIKVARKIRRWKNNISQSVDPDIVQVHMVGQSHIDCAWMWRFEQTRKKAQVTFRKAIVHAKMFPETFCFALSEPLLLEWIKEDDPGLFAQIQEYVKAGNIELVGGAYVGPDCNLPSGEAMVRQRLYGMRFFRDNFGILPTVEWFLDSFGYNFGLPQILKRSGAKYFWTSKLTWNQDTTFPFINFWWQGPDGSKILTSNFNMDTHGLEVWDKFEVGRHLLKDNGVKVWNYTLDYGTLKEHVKDEICPHVGAFFGVGDGGHGPTHKEVAIANELVKNKLCKWSRVGTFFEEVEKYSESFPIWNDELYLENHRGCNSNHWEVKRHNRKYENMIVSLETLALLTSFTNPGYKYPKEQLEKLWKITLKNQFHDVLPGTSIPEVYDEVWDDWNNQEESIRNIIENIGNAATGNQQIEATLESTEVILYNQLTWDRKSRIFIPITVFKNLPSLDKEGKPNFAKLELLNENNEVFICQPISAEPDYGLDSKPAGWWAVINLKPLSLTPARLIIQSNSTSEDLGKKGKLNATENSLSSEKVKIDIDHDTGAIVDLFINEINNGNNLVKGNSSNLTYGFLDKGTPWPAWNIVRQYWNYPIELSNEKDVKIRVAEIGPIFATIEISRTLGISSVIQKITLFKDSPEIYLEYNSDWKQENIMLKILYSTSTDAEIAIADGTYCAIKFKTKPETPCDKARYEKVCHKYFDISTNDNRWGLALLNEGKYAFDVTGGDIRLTLLRACLYPPPAPEAWANLERSENEKLYGHTVPKHSGIGPFRCRYALLPHNGGALVNANGTPNVIVKRKAEEFNNPVMVIPLYNSQLNAEEILAFNEPLLQILTPNIYLGALKLDEWENTNNFIARFVEGSGIPSVVKVKLNSILSNKISSISAVDLLEREIDYKFEWDSDIAILSFEIGKFEISTFKFKI